MGVVIQFSYIEKEFLQSVAIRTAMKFRLYTQDVYATVVDCRLLREGDRIDGVTVVKIYEDRVEFEKDGKRWTRKEGDAPDPAWR